MARIVAQKAPNLPIAPTAYTQQFIEQYSNVLRLYFNAGDNAMGALLGATGGDYLRASYGSFYSTATQTASVIDTAYPVTFGTVGIVNGVSHGVVTSQIKLPSAGVYNIQFSGNAHTTAGTGNLFFWLRVNATNVAATGGKVATSTSDVVVSRNYVYEFAAGDYFEIVWSASVTTVEFLAVAVSAPVPAVPSVALIVTRVSGPS